MIHPPRPLHDLRDNVILSLTTVIRASVFAKPLLVSETTDDKKMFVLECTLHQERENASASEH